jgi:GxxExxY protein
MPSEEKDPRTFSIIGAAMEVHRQMGCGFVEPVYQEAMEIELTQRAIPFEPQVELSISYKGQHLRAKYKPDLICFENVVVELKALSCLGGSEEAQIINYLKATGFHVGLLLNFGSSSLQYKRFVL